MILTIIYHEMISENETKQPLGCVKQLVGQLVKQGLNHFCKAGKLLLPTWGINKPKADLCFSKIKDHLCNFLPPSLPVPRKRESKV